MENGELRIIPFGNGELRMAKEMYYPGNNAIKRIPILNLQLSSFNSSFSIEQ